jgi:hypothetical protein
MVRKVSKFGGIYHEPPYTEEEERDFYRRFGRRVVAFIRDAPAPAKARSEQAPPREARRPAPKRGTDR